MGPVRPIYEDRGARWFLVFTAVLCSFGISFLVAALAEGLEGDERIWVVIVVPFMGWGGVHMARLAVGSCYRAELAADTLIVEQFRRTRHIPVADLVRIRTRRLGDQFGIGSTFYVIEFVGGEAVLDADKGGREFATELIRAAPLITTKGWTPDS